MDEASEAELLARAKDGDKSAFEKLILPLLPTLLAYSRTVCGDYQAAQDVVQETALIAYRNLGRFFADADFATWLKAIARRQALAARRKLGRVSLVIEDVLEAAYDDFGPQAVAPERAALGHCLEALPPRSRRLIEGRYVAHSGLAALAAELKTNLSTLRWQLFRVRQALRDCIKRRLGGESVS